MSDPAPPVEPPSPSQGADISLASASPSPRPARALLRALAWFGVIASFPVWIASFTIAPFLPLSITARAVIAAGLYAAGEVLFWVGALVLGADALRALKDRALGWLRTRGRSTAPDSLAPREGDAETG